MAGIYRETQQKCLEETAENCLPLPAGERVGERADGSWATLRAVPRVSLQNQRAIAVKVLAGFEAAAAEKLKLARREGPQPEWAVAVSTEMFELDVDRITATLSAFDEVLETDRRHDWLRLWEKHR